MANYRNGRGRRKGTQRTTVFIEERQILVQPKQSYAPYTDDPDTNNDSKDFESLINVPASANAQLTFESEKNWSADVSGCFEYFTLDLKLISAAMKCIPFNECVQINDEYFTADQLTNFHNAVEDGKKGYKHILSNLEVSNSTDIATSTRLFDEKIESEQSGKHLDLTAEIQSRNNGGDNSDEDLDFLLSLESPTIKSDKDQTTSKDVLCDRDLKMQSEPLPTKPIDLESWLDSILDD